MTETVFSRWALYLAISCVLVLSSCSSSSSNNQQGVVSEPSGPETEPPGQDDEPLPEDALFNTASDFPITREPGPRLPLVEEPREFSDADFARGLPEAELFVPDGLDITTNRPPFFENLENRELLAGDVLEVVYLPQDPDGELPGMFPVKLPQGSSFIDNFDGSKTFRWQPLQMDVGISEFTVTAVDSADSRLRVSQSILIKVVLPDDPGTIPNVAPMLDEVVPYTARINDPVVFELKGIDLNGSIPTIELPDSTSGALVGAFANVTLTQSPRFEEIFVLKFVPTTVGVLSIDIVVRDSVDTSLFTTETIELSVRSASDFERAGQPLRELAQNRNIDIGFAASQSFYHRPDGALYADTAAREFNIVTPENSMKMDYLNPEPGRYQFAATDNLIAYANLNDMVVHGHPLIWYRQNPAWIEASPPAEREGHMRDYITRIMSRYQQQITIWDVVNEPIGDNGGFRDSVWFEAMGEQYIEIALEQARSVSPSDTLLINEFDIAMAGPKFDSLIQLVDDLQTRNVPLDGIGFQLHLFATFNTVDQLRANFAAVAERGLDIYITELDVSLTSDTTLSDQASVYREIVGVCLEQPNCKAIQTWGFTDQYSFRSIFDPLLFDRAYQPKPAYQAVQDALIGVR